MNVEAPYPKLFPTDIGFWVPIPGIGSVYVIAILTILPLTTAAVPIYWILGVPVEDNATPTLISVAIPTYALSRAVIAAPVWDIGPGNTL